MAFIPDISTDDIRLEVLDLVAGEVAFRASMDDLRNTVLQIPPFKDPVEWIAENITLSKQTTSRPGPMRLTVYQRELARCLMDSDVDQIDVLKGVQVGYSRCLAALQLYGVSYLAIHVAIAQPTVKDAESYFKDQIAPLFEEVEAAKSIVRRPVRGEVQDTITEHRYSNGAILRLRGADNPDSLRRFSSEWNFADEVDAQSWQDGAGNQQGSKFDLFRDRGTDFPNSKFVNGSTPLIRDTSLVWKAYAKSDQRKLEVRCPHCDTPQLLRWGDGKGTGFHYTRDADTRAVTDCWYECAGPKKCRIDEVDKEEMVESGVYKPTSIPDRPGHVGLHWPSWHSMAPKAAWIVLAQRWVDSQGDPEKLQTFVNNVMAEPWDDLLHGGGLEDDTAKGLATSYPAEAPDDVIVLTAGVDTQSNKEGKGTDSVIASREVTIVGWSVHRMPRVVGHWIIPGEPGDKTADDALDEILMRSFSKQSGKKLTVTAAAVDMGGHYGDATKAFCAKRYRRLIWAIKGHNTTKGKRLPTVWPRKASRNSKSAHQFFTICSQGARDFIGRALRITGPGRATFPASLPAAYFDGLSAEKFVTDKKSGLGYWTRKSKTNTGESWICLAYAYAALCGLQASRPEWRDLNLAAARQGISLVPPHDPETGEITEVAYTGPDRSAQSVAEEAEAAGPAPAQPDGAGSRKGGTLSEKAAATRPTGNAVGTPKQWATGRLPGMGRTPRSSWMSR